MFTLLLFPLIVVAAQPAAPPVDKGWELRIEAPWLAEPALVGQYLDGNIGITLKNTTDKERGYVAVPRAIERGVLEAEVVQPDRQGPRRIGGPPIPDDFKTLTPVAAGKEVSFSVPVARFRYTNLLQAGKHTLRVTYTTPDGRVTSNTIAFTVYNPEKDDVLARHQLPLVGSESAGPPDARVLAVLDQVRIEDKPYLIYRRYAATKFGGACIHARRLTELPRKVELIAVGAFGNVGGNPEPLFIAYSHKANAITTLRVESIAGEVQERLVFEAKMAYDVHEGWALFKDIKFDNRDDIPPEKLRLTYAAFVASVKTGGQAKFCLNSVEVIDREVPDRTNSATGINIPWMKQNFSADVVMCSNGKDDTFYLRTSTSSMYWVQTRSGEWKLFRYADKPIK